MTAYALELIRKHDARVAANNDNLANLQMLRERLRKTEDHIKRVGTKLRSLEGPIDLLPMLKPDEVPKKATEMATPDIIAFNNNLLKV